MPRIYSSREIGRIVGADPSSINRWIDAGILRAFRTPGGHRRVLEEDLLDFLEESGMPLPEDLQVQQRHVLLVDEDKSWLRTTRRALMRADETLQVQMASSIIEALILIGDLHPDLVVLNVHGAKIDPVDLCQQILQVTQAQGTMVVATTKQHSPTLEKRLKEVGVAQVLAKPFNAIVLLEMFGS
ncbi:MAG: response regulator [Pseudomonadota bacterium]